MACKRVADIMIALTVLLILSPLLLIVAAVISFGSPGGSIFRQQRIGRYGRPFFIYKFRTMYVEAPPDAAAADSDKTEPYITPFGRLLRRTSIDEIPQLWNVLKGDMSLVGPRPVVVAERELLRLRHESGAIAVRPGITGLAQVSGRGKLTPAQKAAFDEQYMCEQSFRLDVRILLATCRCLLHGH